jgi:hypothetical protein
LGKSALHRNPHWDLAARNEFDWEMLSMWGEMVGGDTSLVETLTRLESEDSDREQRDGTNPALSTLTIFPVATVSS